jgi:transposase
MTAFAVPSMLTQEQAVEIRVMARRGEGVRSIAKQLGCSRNTVRRYLREESARRYGPRAPRACKLDPYKEYLSERAEQARPRWIPATVLLREISERGYGGGISQLKAWLVPLKKREVEPVVRFETPAGKQMQADFTYVRRGRDPLLALVATLGYSRASFVKFTTGEDAATLCAGLRDAFDYFGGVPEHVLFDNTKAVVIERDAYGQGLHRWNDELKTLAEACGFVPRLCRPYRAKTKAWTSYCTLCGRLSGDEPSGLTGVAAADAADELTTIGRLVQAVPFVAVGVARQYAFAAELMDGGR